MLLFDCGFLAHGAYELRVDGGVETKSFGVCIIAIQNVPHIRADARAGHL